MSSRESKDSLWQSYKEAIVEIERNNLLIRADEVTLN